MGKTGHPSIEEQRLFLRHSIDEAENQIRQLVQASLTMKRDYNALSPPNRLPVEVLSLVLTFHSIPFTLLQGASQNRKCLERIRVAHVCHRWREVALGLGELWSNLLFVTRGIAELMVRWSKGTPLAITFKHGDPRWIAPFSDIIGFNLPRLRSLEVASVGTNIHNADFVSLLAFPTPILEKLVLRSCEPGSGLGDCPAPRLPDGFLQSHSGQLKHLEIMDFWISNLDMLPPTLTHLQLGSERPHTIARLSLSALLRVLRRLPRLETLYLNHYAPEAHPPGLPSVVAECPSLLDVRINDITPAINNLLQYIRIPRASIQLLFLNALDSTDDLRQLLATLAKSRKISRPLALDELSVRETGSFPHHILLDLSFGSQGAEVCSTPPKICVGFPRPIRQNLMELISLFGESCVEKQFLCSLRMMSRRCKFSRREWIVLGRLPSLKSISFSRGAEAIDFCEALNDDAGSVKQAPPSFSTLSSISLEGVSLTWGSYLYSYVRHSLVTALNHRPKNYRVAELNITRSDRGFSERDQASLQEAVPGLKVVWAKSRDNWADESDSEEESDPLERFHEPEDSDWDD